MTTKPEEIARVRGLHKRLDYLVELAELGVGGFAVDLSGGHHEYTAEEVRRWPEVKAGLLRKPAERPTAEAAFLGESGLFETLSWASNMAAYARGNHARGLCLYREMLPADPAREEASFIDEDGVKRFNLPDQPAAKAPDPYNPDGLDLGVRLAEEAIIRDAQRQSDDLSGRRARLIAALQAEQRAGESRGLLLRHPAEGRSERALPRSNGR